MYYSIIQYMGGKAQLAKKIVPYLLTHQFSTFVEPFIGPASISLHLLHENPRIKQYIWSDIEPNLANFWNQTLRNTDLVLNQITQYFKLSFEELAEIYHYWRISPDYTSNYPIESAAIYFISNKMIFCGENLSRIHLYKPNTNPNNLAAYQRWNKKAQGLKAFSQHSDFIKNNNHKIIFFQQSYSETLKILPDQSLIYLDPPYDLGQKYYYGDFGSTHKGFNHIELRDELYNINTPWIMSYNKNEYIESLYKDMNIIEIKHKHRSRRKLGNKIDDCSELLISNFSV